MRWTGCFTLALGIHATVAAAMLAHWHDEADAVWSAPAITVDLAPTPAAPAVTQTNLPPGPVKPQQETLPQVAEKKPVEKIEKPPEPEKPEVKTDMKPAPIEKHELAMQPPSTNPVEKTPEQKKKKPQRKMASLASAPSPAEQHAERAAALAPGASGHNSNAVPNWKSQLVAWLDRYKRYPPEAQSRGDQGVVQLAFSIDHQGGVHHARILHSSGSKLLDEATMGLIERAAPLPPPPAEMPGAQIAIVVPIKYSIR